MKRIILTAIVLAVFAAAAPVRAQVFFEDFEGDLSIWVGKGGGAHHGQIVTDPLDGSNKVLNFTALNAAGDIFSPALAITPGVTYTLSFDYLGYPDTGDDLGGFLGYSLGTPGTHYWLAGTQAGYPGLLAHLIDDGTWHTYSIDIVPSASSIRIMLEDYQGSDGIIGNAYFDNITLKLAALEVEIDIKPGSWPNAINLGSKGVIPAAVLSSVDFDATTVEPSTVLLGGVDVAVKGKSGKLMAHFEDVNSDGLTDLVVQVNTEAASQWTSGTLMLTATTYDNQDIIGFDEIVIVPPKKRYDIWYR